jgi:AraC family transcriptional regulator, regulatory protein of adaptative response / methylated-DNA-[protein]-cysteine methyltransferase
MNNYEKIAHAIGYIKTNYNKQPALDEIAEKVHLSPFHFQRIFKEWAGVTPKEFLQFLTIEHAKKILKEKESTLLDATYETGLSGTSRLHDLFIKIEGMTPGEYKNGGKELAINYSFADTPFGKVIISSTSKGICHLAFTDEEEEGLIILKNKFPNATYKNQNDANQVTVLRLFSKDWNNLGAVKLHLKGTPFQIKVWEALLKIPVGKLSTYNQLATVVGNPKASRAVGTAVGDNPVAFLIPCHRVIRSTGEIGQYHWGSNRKSAIIGWEAASISNGN